MSWTSMFNEATFWEILLPSSCDGRSISWNVALLNILVHKRDKLTVLFLVLFQAERLLVFFIYGKLKDLFLPLVTGFLRTEVIQEHTFAKLIKLEFNKSTQLLPSSYVDVGFAANGVSKKLGKLESTKER